MQLEPVWAALQREPHRSFVLIGTADAVFDRAKIEQLRDGGACVALVEGGDHGLDVGDAVESARRLAEALVELRAFLAE